MFLGIDPGANGAAALIGDGNHNICRFDKATEADIAQWFWEAKNAGWAPIEFAMIERVSSSPQMGVASAFKFGQSYGFLRGLLIANKIPFEEVTPQTWQKVMGCRTKGDKNVTKAKAQQLFPQVKVNHGNADGLLIAEYCRRTREGVGV